jgi:UDP-N-acetylmuramate--alanine ligase
MLFKDIPIRHRHIHFIGIGGIGMSGIAEILLNLGYPISGSDLRESAVTKRLVTLGARIFEGHRAANTFGAEAIVVSSAIPASNPELIAARERNIPIIARGELLAELMRLKYGIAIGGSHGKTTTTSMTAAVLNHAGKDPTVVVGGRVDSMGSNAKLGKSDLLLVESDESDGSLLRLSPILAVITNIDHEHLDHYHSFESLADTFVEFANRVPFYGTVILCLDDANVRSILPRVKRQMRTYGTVEQSPQADLKVSDVRCGHLESRFRLTFGHLDLGEFLIHGAGRHNVLNAAAAALVGIELEIAPQVIREGLAGFSGVDRRFQIKGVAAGVTVIDDYGHHPTEIAATLAAARTCQFEKVHVVFQPHRYTRTHLLADEFARCFTDCDTLFVLDIYSAGEQPIEGVDAGGLAARIAAARGSEVEYVESMELAITKVAAAARAGDAIVTLGAGSIWQAGEKILAELTSRAADDARHLRKGRPETRGLPLPKRLFGG